MELYDVMEKRRTIRDFTGEIVSDDVLTRVLNAAFYAPTNDHMRQFEFVVVKGGEKIAEIVADFDKNYNLVLDGIHAEAAKGNIDKDKYDMFLHAVPRQKRMLIESGCIVLPYFRQQGCPLLEPGKLHGLNFFASAWAALENIFLAAANEGLATCIHIPMGDEVERINAMVAAPKDYELTCVLAIGYAKPDAHICKQKEISVRDRIHTDKW